MIREEKWLFLMAKEWKFAQAMTSISSCAARVWFAHHNAGLINFTGHLSNYGVPLPVHLCSATDS
jgi:hypothetical protein